MGVWLCDLLKKCRDENALYVKHFLGEQAAVEITSSKTLQGGEARTLPPPRGLPEKGVIKILTQTLSAIKYAHSKRVLHGNISPKNIYVLSGGEILNAISTVGGCCTRTAPSPERGGAPYVRANCRIVVEKTSFFPPPTTIWLWAGKEEMK